MAGSIAEEHKSKLEIMKSNVTNAYENFRHNYNRFNEYRTFFFKTSINDDDEALLRELNKPVIETNLGESYISRQMGEFAKQEPSIEVRAAYGEEIDTSAIEIVDGYMRHTLADSNKKNFEYRVMDDLYSGGWSVMKLKTDYLHELSFDQDFVLERVYEPTLCGFDPMSREPNKQDGEFCFENIPMEKKFFKKKYKKIELDNVSFVANQTGFSWSYTAQNDVEILIVCDFYKKKRKSFKIVKLATQEVMREEEYKKMLEEWTVSGNTAQPPVVIDERRTEEVKIVRYRFIETEVIEYEETDFKDFPLIYVDGNSKQLRNGEAGSFELYTRPYLYHCKDVQRLMNFSVQTLANFLENMVMHKFKIAKESIPQEEDFLAPYSTIQEANQIVYNAYKDDDVDKPLPAPQEIQIPGAPPEMMGTVKLCMELFQSILGSYDSALGINDNQLSGKAIDSGAMNSNAAAMPYIVGFIQGLSHAANMIVYLIPKYLHTPRSIPVRNIRGENSYQEVNTPGNPSLKYNNNALHVIVKAGVNFAVQQQKAFNTIITLMKSSKQFDNFINTKGLNFLLDNVDCRGIEKIKKETDEWMKQQEQIQKKAQNQPNPLQLKAQAEMMKIQGQMKKQHDDMKIHEDEMQLKHMELDVDKMEILADLEKQEEENYRADEKLKTERIMHASDHALSRVDTVHRHRLERDKHALESKLSSREKK